MNSNDVDLSYINVNNSNVDGTIPYVNFSDHIDPANSFTNCSNDFEIVNSIYNTFSSCPQSSRVETNTKIKLCNLMAWNIQGLRPKLYNREFKEFCSTFDIFSLSEIQSCTEKLMRDSFPEFEVFISRRTVCNGGGVAVFVNKTIIKFVTQIVSHADECLFFLVKRSILNESIDSDLIISFPYIAHEYSAVYNNMSIKGIELLEHNLNYIFNKVGYLPCLIAGDLNSRVGTLSDVIRSDHSEKFYNDVSDLSPIIVDIDLPERSTSDLEINLFGRDLVRFCKDNDMCILNGRLDGDRLGKTTCIANGGRSVVDYVITCKSIYNEIEEMRVNPRAESDHFPVCLSFSSKNCQNTSQIPTQSKPKYPLTYFNKVSWNENNQDNYFNNFIRSLTENKSTFFEKLANQNIDSAINLLNNCIKNSTARQYDKYKNNPKKQPGWFDRECEELKRKKFEALDRFHHTNSEPDLHFYLNSKRLFKNLCKTKKCAFNRVEAGLLLDNSLKPNSKNFWKQIKHLTTPKYEHSSNNISPREWYDYFKNILNTNIEKENENETHNEHCIDNMNMHNTVNNLNNMNDNIDEDCLNGEITEAEVNAALKNIKSGKSSLPDGIPPEFYKHNSPIYIEYLVALFNAIFISEMYPSEWAKSMIFTLHKKGSIYDINNYRGISLLNVLGKIFSHVLNARLKLWCDQNDVIPEAQAGFRSEYSTVDNIFVLQSMVQKYLGKPKGRFYILFVDFFKAFDWVDRKKLWCILNKNGCNGKMLRILKSMYSSVWASVKVLQSSPAGNEPYTDYNMYKENICLTDYFECLCGVKQGCVLSPILFSIFISEFDKEMSMSENIHGVELLSNDVKAKSLLYADDLTVFADNVKDLQRSINALESFCTKWGLKINTNKSKVIVFRNGGYLRDTEKWWLGGEKLECMTYYNYQGMLFSSRLCWSHHIETIASKGSRIVTYMKRCFSRFDGMDRITAFKVFDIKIKPILLYGAEIWGIKYYNAIEHVQIKYCKAFLGIGKTTPNCLALSELGRQPLYVDYVCKAVKYWCKLTRLNESRYARKSYIQQYRHAEMGRDNWAASIRDILFRNGFGFVWNMQEVCDVRCFIRVLRDRLCASGIQSIQSDIREKYETYLNFNPFIQSGSYIDKLYQLHKRRLITLLRTNSLPINNNLYRIQLQNNTVCTRCNINEVDDEFHFMFICPSFTVQRNLYLLPENSINPTEVNLIDILSSDKEEIINNMYLFLKSTVKLLRNNELLVD